MIESKIIETLHRLAGRRATGYSTTIQKLDNCLILLTDTEANRSLHLSKDKYVVPSSHFEGLSKPIIPDNYFLIQLSREVNSIQKENELLLHENKTLQSELAERDLYILMRKRELAYCEKDLNYLKNASLWEVIKWKLKLKKNS